MREVGKNKHQAFWIEALDAKFEGRGELFNREKFDQILGPYEVCFLPTLQVRLKLLAYYLSCIYWMDFQPVEKFSVQNGSSQRSRL